VGGFLHLETANVPSDYKYDKFRTFTFMPMRRA